MTIYEKGLEAAVRAVYESEPEWIDGGKTKVPYEKAQDLIWDTNIATLAIKAYLTNTPQVTEAEIHRLLKSCIDEVLSVDRATIEGVIDTYAKEILWQLRKAEPQGSFSLPEGTEFNISTSPAACFNVGKANDE